MTPADVIVGIGRNIGETPMYPAQWIRFRLAVMRALGSRGQLVAEVEGPSWSPQWGSEGAAWFAGSIDSARELAGLRADLAELARRYGQDAIALTVGQTELVGSVAAAS